MTEPTRYKACAWWSKTKRACCMPSNMRYCLHKPGRIVVKTCPKVSLSEWAMVPLSDPRR